MKYRIAVWATAGFLVAVGWAVYAFASTPPALTFNDPIMTLVRITCPIAWVRAYPDSYGMDLSRKRCDLRIGWPDRREPAATAGSRAIVSNQTLVLSSAPLSC